MTTETKVKTAAKRKSAVWEWAERMNKLHARLDYARLFGDAE